MQSKDRSRAIRTCIDTLSAIQSLSVRGSLQLGIIAMLPIRSESPNYSKAIIYIKTLITVNLTFKKKINVKINLLMIK